MKKTDSFWLVIRHLFRSSNPEFLLDAEQEKRLVMRCRQGDRSAYALLVRAYSRRVFAICLGVTSNIHDAEDIAQQALLKGFISIGRLRSNLQFGAWVGQIARNLSIDFIRRERIRRGVSTKKKELSEHRPETYRQLEIALAGLEEEYRLPLLLYYFDGRSTKNISKILGISQSGVQTRLSRGRKQLRKLLESKGDER